jgi:DNA mismatch repair protein MutL
MPDIIRLLPENVANQIAAGEVVQRPASVVKELLENAVDAGATEIQLTIKESGKTWIQVVDNGCGMSETDARMSLERHATSKISKAEDLFNIRTMGFRGEALASIASVASVEIQTKRQEDEMGTRLLVEGSELKVHEPVSCPNGTTIIVKNLFFNIPVRKNFLKSNPVEYKHIVEEFYHVALANPHLKFVFSSGNSTIHHLQKGKLKQRLSGIFSKKTEQNVVFIEEMSPIVKISGFIGKPEFAKKTRGEQYLFVNNRFIKNPYFNHAIVSAYENLLPSDSFPFYVLFFEIESDKIDVNIHPTKTEVKFEEEKAIYAILRATIKKALSQNHFAPSLDFEQEAFINQFAPEKRREEHSKLKFDFGENISRPSQGIKKSSEKDWKELLEVLKDKPENSNQDVQTQESDKSRDIFPEEMQTAGFSEDEKILQIRQKYIFTSIQSGIILIHQNLAHQRILYEGFLKTMENENASGIQKNMFPEVIELNASDYELMMEVLPTLEKAGLVLEKFGKKAFVVNGVPAGVNIEDAPGFIENLIEEYKNNLGNSELNLKQKVAASLSAKAAIKTGQLLNKEKMKLLVDQLFACENPYYSPNGKPVLLKIDISELDKKFE